MDEHIIKAIPNVPTHLLLTNDELAFIFGRRLKDLIHRRGINRHKLGRRIGFKETTIDSYAQGRRKLTLRSLIGLAMELGEDMNKFLRLTHQDFDLIARDYHAYPYRNQAYKSPKRQRPKPYNIYHRPEDDEE